MLTAREFDRVMTLKDDERDQYLFTLTLEDQEDFQKRLRVSIDEMIAKVEANKLEFQTKLDRIDAATNEEIAKIDAKWQREESNNRKSIYKAVGIFVVCPLALWFFFKASPEELAARAAKEAESKALYDDYEAKRAAKAADEESAKINNSIRYKFILQTDLEASQGSKLSEQQNTELIRRAQEACGLYDPSIPSADGCK